MKYLCIIAFLLLFSFAGSALAAGLPVETYVSGGTTIHVEVAPASGSGVYPSVILLYGENGEVGAGNYFESLATAFASAGMNCFIIHYLDKGAPIPGPAMFTEYLKVISDGVTWASAQPNVDPTKIMIMGISLGGTLAITEVTTDTRVKALAAWSTAESMWYEFDTHQTITYMPPTIIIHGGEDPISPVTDASALQTLLQSLGVPNEIEIYPNEGHAFNAADTQQAFQQTLAFFQIYVSK